MNRTQETEKRAIHTERAGRERERESEGEKRDRGENIHATRASNFTQITWKKRRNACTHKQCGEWFHEDVAIFGHVVGDVYVRGDEI